eukprot:6510627-Pyramimonas_sp.AAC.1
MRKRARAAYVQAARPGSKALPNMLIRGCAPLETDWQLPRFTLTCRSLEAEPFTSMIEWLHLFRPRFMLTLDGAMIAPP